MSSLLLPRRRQVAAAAISITGTNASTSALAETARLANVPSSAPAAAGAAKVKPSRQQTRPWRASDPAPTAAASETTTSDAVEAGPTGSSST